MDEEGLHQYFTIGSGLKKTESVSPRFHRKRIGEFGIGKFAALSACKRFMVETRRGSFHARLVFDKEQWSRHEDWHLNVDILPPDSTASDGTTVTLSDLETAFVPGKVRRYLSERTPIHAPDFTVLLNGDKVTDDLVTGRQVKVAFATPTARSRAPS